VENHGAFVRNNDSFIQNKRWYINLIAVLHFLRSYFDFLGSIIVIQTLPPSVELGPTFVVSIIELLFGILILMKKKYALILFSPILILMFYNALLFWNWIFLDTISYIFFSSLLLELILCTYLGISWLRNERFSSS